MVRSEAPELLRDQRRALHAYDVVGGVRKSDQRDYKIAVNDLGANVLRSGLAAALASLERQKAGRGGMLLAHLAGAGIAGLENATTADFAKRARELDAAAYMLATHEVLQVATWLKRAAQATFGDDRDA